MAEGIAAGSASFNRWHIKTNMDMFVTRRLWEASLMSEAATKSHSTPSRTQQPPQTSPSSERMDKAWKILNQAFHDYFRSFWPLLSGYLSILDLDFEAIDTVEGTVRELQLRLEDLAPFGAKSYLNSIYRPLQRYIEQEPELNLDKGAFVSLVEALWQSMPSRAPHSVQKRLEAKLGKQLTPEELTSFPVRVQSGPARHSILSKDYWRNSTEEGPLTAQFEDVIETFKEAGRKLIQAAAAWKFAIYLETPKEVGNRPLFVLPARTVVDEETGAEMPHRAFKRQRRGDPDDEAEDDSSVERVTVDLQTVVESATRRMERMRDEHV